MCFRWYIATAGLKEPTVFLRFQVVDARFRFLCTSLKSAGPIRSVRFNSSPLSSHPALGVDAERRYHAGPEARLACTCGALLRGIVTQIREIAGPEKPRI